MENIINEPAIKYNYLSQEEYLELMNGKIITMTGASLKHNRIVRNLLRDIGGFLKGKTCEVFPSDLRVGIPALNSFTYPDITIVCGKPELLDDKFDTLLNPSVIIEVLSPSTESYDRGSKFFTYQQIPTFKEYILINSTSLLVHTMVKNDDDLWKIETIIHNSSTLNISVTGQQILLGDIYDQVDF